MVLPRCVVSRLLQICCMYKNAYFVFQDYLRNIPNSLLMEELFDDWVAANEIENLEEKNNKLRE